MNKFKLVSLLVAFSTAVISCTDVNLDFGEDYVPDSEVMYIGQTVFNDFTAYTLDVDSVPTSLWGSTLLGSIVSTTWGQTNLSFITTYLPYSGLDADSIWGDNPTIDSVKLVLTTTGYAGNDEYKKQVVAIHQLNKEIPESADSLYYSNFDYSSYIDSEKLATITIDSTGSFEAHLPISFAEPLLDTNGWYFYYDTLFIKKAPGLYFESEKFFSAGVYRNISLSGSGFNVYYHNENVGDPDTTAAFFSFYNYATYDDVNKAITMIDHNYSLADPILGLDTSIINDSINSSNTNYVLSQAGLMTRLHFSKDEFDAFKENISEQGYGSIAVSNATLSIPIENPTPAVMDTTLYRLGTYYDYQDQYCIEDYSYDISIVENGSVSDYNGYLNRLRGAYVINITSYVQALIRGEEDDYSIELAPELGASMTYRGATLDCSDITLDITYMLMK